MQTPSVLPHFHWEFSAPPKFSTTRVTEAFRLWHRGWLLGMEVQSLAFEGRERDEADLRRLNHWIHANGAWRASALPYWDARDVLGDVLSGELRRVDVGRAGGGRWTPRAAVLPFVRDESENFKRKLRPDAR